jgi:hypothetical protein
MKGDVSRETFDATKHYSGVRMQQGRVQTDADWNEQEALQRRRTQVEARDVIGPCGAPEDNAGFEISISGGALRVGAGRFYADGILCENEVDNLAYESQPDLPGTTPWADVLTKSKANFALAYLDVWERHISPLDDPLIREVALGGPDTATRVKTVWQVRLLPITITSNPDRLKQLQAERADAQKKLDALKAAGGDPAEIAKLQKTINKIDAAIAALNANPSCDSDFKEWNDLVADPDRRMNARTAPAAPACGPCVVPPTAGYLRLENQLYRVEVHTPGAAGTATFKWSRDNGSVVTTLEKISGKDLTVHDLGPDDVLGFASGQWVELSDDRLELEGKPGQLAQIDAVNSSLRRITLKAAPTPLGSGTEGVDPAMHPKLRRWDQSGSTATATGVAMTNAFTPLEDGVEVQFGTGTFKTGDYWVIPARTATGEIEWPPFAIPKTAPVPQPPRGIRHHYCRLALLTFDAPTKTWKVASDCRPLFPPLTVPCCTDEAMHVIATNFVNDDAFPIQTFVSDGLRIQLDSPADPASLNTDTVQVMVEAPYTTTSLGMVRVFMDGNVTRDATDLRTIVWKPATPDTTGTSTGTTTGTTGTVQPATGTTGTTVTPGVLTTPISILANNLNVSIANPTRRVTKKSRAKTAAGQARAAAKAAASTEAVARTAPTGAIVLRVLVKGRFIWSDPKSSAKRVYVDGQAYGIPALRADGKTPRIALDLPSGNNSKASDFESWFFIGGRATPTPLQVTQVRFLNANNANSSAGDVKPPLPANTNVTFKAGEQIRMVEITFNRAVAPESVGPNAPSIFIERDTGQGTKPRLAVDLQVASNIVRVVLRDPPFFNQSKFILNCLGSAPVGAAALPVVKAADDQSALDGDYDNSAGGNVALPFTAQ